MDSCTTTAADVGWNPHFISMLAATTTFSPILETDALQLLFIFVLLVDQCNYVDRRLQWCKWYWLGPASITKLSSVLFL